MTVPVPFIPGPEVAAMLSPAAAVAALRQALIDGHDPAADRPRTSFATAHGEMLLMPAEVGGAAGIKVVTVAPGNAALGLPRISGVYVLFDGATLQPVALVDGAALTTLRTPAVSIVAVAQAFSRRTDPLRVVLFGAGPQAHGHLATLSSVLGPGSVREAAYVTRRALIVEPATGIATLSLAAGSAEAREQLRAADVVVCATTAAAPLFDSALVADTAVVIAVGSHEPDRRELDAALLARSQVVVEDAATALREAGDVVLAVAEGALAAADLIPMEEVVTGRVVLTGDRPVVFKSVGMPWQDLVVARVVHDAWRVRPTPDQSSTHSRRSPG